MGAPARRIEDHQLWNAVTVWYVRRALAPDTDSCTGYFKTHPLLLPLHEQSDVLVDYSVLRVLLPLQIKRPRSEIEKMLEPLARLCERCEGTFPEGEWKYEWYYLELLDRDGECRPLCWVDVGLLTEYLVDAEGLRDGSGGRGWVNRYPKRMIIMDSIAAAPPASDEDLAGREEWKEWFISAWRANESKWMEKGLIVYGPVRPWSQMLEFQPDRVEVDAQRGIAWEWSSEGAQRWRWAYAGHPGLYWRMVPLYDQRDMGKIWEAMKRELYRTSVFSVSAKARQDRKLWKHLQERFALPFQRMTLYRYHMRLRERYVLEWTRQGKSLTECARGLLEKGLYPLDTAKLEPVKIQDPAIAEQYLEGARRVVIRIRKRLRQQGLIERGKPGRPRKKR